MCGVACRGVAWRGASVCFEDLFLIAEGSNFFFRVNLFLVVNCEIRTAKTRDDPARPETPILSLSDKAFLACRNGWSAVAERTDGWTGRRIYCTRCEARKLYTYFGSADR